MPERCASRCSTVTSSPISGRSSPSTERAVVRERERAVLDQAATVSAVKPFVPLARAEPGVDRVRDAWPRSARP